MRMHSTIRLGLPAVLGLAAAALLLAVLAPARVQAGGTVGDGDTDQCTETDLLAALNGGGLVTFDCGPDPYTITLTARLVITEDTTIDGGGLITLSGGDSNGIFSVGEGVEVRLYNLTLADGYDEGGGGAVINNGTLVVSNTTFVGNTTDFIDDGGAILNQAVLTVTSSFFYTNTADDGGAIYSNFNDGLGVTPTVFITGSLFQGNEVDNWGGAVFADGEHHFHVAHSIFRNNYASDTGGALAVELASAVPVLIEHSQFENNLAEFIGGAVYVSEAGHVRIEANTFSGNEAFFEGGAWYSEFVESLEITGSTFFNNEALDNESVGGALSLWAGAVTLTHSSVYSNAAGDGGGGVFAAVDAGLYADNVDIYTNEVDGEGLLGGGGLVVFPSVSAGLADSEAGTARWKALRKGLGSLDSLDSLRRFADGVVLGIPCGCPLGGLGINLTLINSRVYSNTASVGGGVLAAFGAGARISQTEVFGNEALGFGGGLSVSGLVELDGVNVHHNTVLGPDGWGAGLDIANYPDEPVSVNNVRVWANTLISGHPDYAGAGVTVAGGPITITNSAIYSNTLIEGSGGGGLHASWAAMVTISNTAIYSNTALNGRGGGIESSDAEGGASVRLINTTVSGNYAPEAGAIYNDPANPSLLLTNVSVVSNTSAAGGSLMGKLTAVNSLVAFNLPANCANSLGSGGYNLESANTCGLNVTGDVTGADPLIEPLAYGGGLNLANLTHALRSGSPATDTASSAACPAYDQRGEPRPLDGDGDDMAVCDKGAFEAPEAVVVLRRLFMPLLMRGQ